MQPIKINATEIQGLVIRTKNADEMNPETSKIGGLWQDFFTQLAPKMTEESTVYGVYYDYESDANGEFNVMAGTDSLNSANSDKELLQTLSIESGNYLVFEAKGDMPQIVIDTWMKIWTFFNDENCAFQRAYTTDFERYIGADKVQIHIAVK